MRKLRNLCIFIILIVLIVVGGTKALLWYYTDKTAKDIQNTLPPGMFNYAGISTSFKGSTSIDDITLAVAGQNVKIEKIELKSKNIFDLLTLIAKNWGSKVPNQLAIRVQGVNINTSSLLAHKQVADMFEHPFALPCGKIKKIGLIEYMEMGYNNIIFDLDLAYDKISNKRTKVNMDFNARDAAQISLSFSGDTNIANPMVKADPTKNIIPEFQLTVKEGVFQRKLYNYCAKQENKSYDEYLKSLPLQYEKDEIDQLTAKNYNLVLNEEVIDALNQYQKDPKEIYIAVSPTADLSFEQLKTMSEEDALKFTRPTLRINGKNIPIKFQWTTSEALAKSKQVTTQYDKPVTQSTERLLTPINELNSKAFNKKIEVHTASGIIYKGAFKKVEAGSLHMVIYKTLGTSDIALKTDSIRLVYILSDF